MDRAIQSLGKFYSALSLAEKIKGSGGLAPVPDKFQKAIDEATDGFEQAMDDDFNTAEAMARFFEVVRVFNNYARKPGKVSAEAAAVAEVFFHWIRDKGSVLALFQNSPAEYLIRLDDLLLGRKDLKRKDIDDLVRQRTEARAAKDYAKSDEVRDKLAELGISVMDSAEGTTWEVAKG